MERPSDGPAASQVPAGRQQRKSLQKKEGSLPRGFLREQESPGAGDRGQRGWAQTRCPRASVYIGHGTFRSTFTAVAVLISTGLRTPLLGSRPLARGNAERLRHQAASAGSHLLRPFLSGAGLSCWPEHEASGPGQEQGLPYWKRPEGHPGEPPPVVITSDTSPKGDGL